MLLCRFGTEYRALQLFATIVESIDIRKQLTSWSLRLNLENLQKNFHLLSPLFAFTFFQIFSAFLVKASFSYMKAH